MTSATLPWEARIAAKGFRVTPAGKGRAAEAQSGTIRKSGIVKHAREEATRGPYSTIGHLKAYVSQVIALFYIQRHSTAHL